MSNDELSEVAVASRTREAVREKAQQVQARQARARVLRRSALGLVIVAAIGAVAYGVYGAIDSVAEQPNEYPDGMESDGVKITSITAQTAGVEETLVDATPSPEPAGGEDEDEAEEEFGFADGVVDIHIYVDYLSPGAGEFQRSNARQLAGWISEGAVSVTYHPVALLTANSNGTKYSQRAAAAAACVATHSPAQFYAYNHELLVNQPDLDSDGFSDAELADLAVAVGIDNSKRVRTCIDEQRYMLWAKDATTRALDGPLPGSDDLVLAAAPMVVIDGQTYVGALNNPAEFSQFVLTVASDAYYSTPSPAPSPDETSDDD